jgi:hypothetical protein
LASGSSATACPCTGRAWRRPLRLDLSRIRLSRRCVGWTSCRSWICATSACRTGLATSRTPIPAALRPLRPRVRGPLPVAAALHTGERGDVRPDGIFIQSEPSPITGGRTRWSWTPARRATHRGNTKDTKNEKTRRECVQRGRPPPRPAPLTGSVHCGASLDGLARAW